MEPPSMDTVYQAISALYDNPNAQEKEKASLWLGDVQKSIHSWKIADELLQQKKDVQSSYFAAQTMRSKVQHNLYELPADALISLRDSLIAHLKCTSPESSPAILTQLSLALADLALQMVAWQDCVGDFIRSFSNTNDYALLEILTVLPQEIDSSSLKLGENRREDIKSELRSNSQIVTLFLKESLSSTQNTQVALRIVKCLTSWIQVRAIHIQEVPQNAVVGFCLQVLGDHNAINLLHDAASDCICALLHCLEENNNDVNVERLLFDSIVDLENSYHMAVASEEEVKAANYARVFTELAESFLDKIIRSAANSESHFAMRALELVLVCVGHHDYEVAEITFNLWYRLSEDVYRIDTEPLTNTFKPHIERLIAALARHCQCEPDQSQLPNEGDEFYEFRLKVTELIKDVVFIVGSSSVFRQMFATLLQHSDASWEQTEAALFIMQAVAKNILPDEYEYVPKVVEAILSMPDTTHIAVRKTCTQLLGELCEWIEKHPTCLDATMHCLIRALYEKELALPAAKALQSICSVCVVSSSSVSALFDSARSLSGAPPAPPAPPAVLTPLLGAMVTAVKHLPKEQMETLMRELIRLQLTSISGCLTETMPVSETCARLDRLASVFKGAPALALLLEETWPLMSQVLEKFVSTGRVMERWCRAVRFAVRAAGLAARPALPALADALAAAYSTHQHSCFLYLTSILVDELWSLEECVTPLIGLVQELLPRAFTLLQTQNGLRDNPDTVDDLFRLCIRYLQRTPVPFVSSGACRAGVAAGAEASALDHRDASASVMKYLHDVARAALYDGSDAKRATVQKLAKEIMTELGPTVTAALISAAALHVHAALLGEIAEALVPMLRLQTQCGSDWLSAALAGLPSTPPCATPQQCAQLHHYAISAEKTKTLTRLLRDFAKLYR